MTEPTDQQQKPWLFKPGQSGNPSGRPTGSRNKLGEAFVSALYEDFQQNGAETIKVVRAEKPDVYLKVIAQVVPKELLIKEASLEDMSDDELVELAAALRSLTAADTAKEGKPRTRKAKATEDPGETGRLN